MTEPEPEPETIHPPQKSAGKAGSGPVKRQIVTSDYNREIPHSPEPGVPSVRKPEVQSAMKVAMKGALKPLGQTSQQPVRRTVQEPPRRVVQEVEPNRNRYRPPRRPVVPGNNAKEAVSHEEPSADTPQFCHNCGKKLPHSANFCPGCGTKLNQGRTLPHSHQQAAVMDKRATRTDPPGHEHRISQEPADDEENEDEKPSRSGPR